MPISKNTFNDYEKYARKYMVIIKDVLDCEECPNKCENHAVELNYREMIVDNLNNCPCYNELETGVWRPGLTIKPGENATIQLIEKRDDFKRTVIIENGKIIDKPDDIDILGVETPFGFEIRGLRRKN